MNLIPFVLIWCALAVVVLALAIYRNLTALHEDDMLHLASSEQRMIPKQIATFRRLDVADRWGKTLTVITLIGGILLAVAYLYRAWMAAYS